MEESFLNHPFQPFVFPDSRILVLGSFPSVLSRTNRFYYGNPKNRFFLILSVLYNGGKELKSVEEKKKVLKENRIALFDVIQSCSLKGSSDASIRSAVPNDIPSLLKGTSIERIVCNGKKSGELLERFYPDLLEKTLVLPSTSPANASYSLERLVSIYREAFSFSS